jgi:peptide/nickel transport system substrate-binding protein
MTSEYWQRFAKRRMSRRSVLKAGAAAGLGVAAYGLVGCGGGNKSPSSTATSTALPIKTGGTFRTGSVQNALSIDPHTDVGLGLTFAPYIYGYLMHQVQVPNSEPEMIWDLAESMEMPDDLTYIFKMRQGVHFQDLPPVNGREVTADDVVYSLNRIAELQPEPLLTEYADTWTAPDPSTFRFALKRPYAYVEDLGAAAAAIVPKEAVEQFGDLKTKGIGSGPFIVDSFTPSDRIEMSRNPNYYVSGIPYVDGIENRSIADEAAFRVAFKGKQLDVYAPPTKVQADEVAGYGDVNLVKEPGLLVYKIQVNELSRPELGDERVREAIDIAIDRDQLIQKLAFGEGEYTGPVSPALTYWSLPLDELHDRLKRDLDKSKQLLEAAGASNLTLDLKFPSNTSTDLSVLVAAQLTEAGIKVNVKGEEYGTWFSDRSALNFELSIGGGLPYADEHYPIQFNHTNDWNRKNKPYHPPLPELDAELDQIMATPDTAERHDLVLDVTRKYLDRHGPLLYLYVPYTYTARWSYVHGFENVPSSKWGLTYDMWLDK